MNKILVIGGCGYIGSVLVRQLVELGNNVHVLDNLRFRQKPFLDLCHHENFSITIGDFRDVDLCRKLLPGFDTIICLAAVVGAKACSDNVFEAQTLNVDAVKNMLSVLSPSQTVLYPCTNSGYGIGAKDIYCTEETPLRPISLYGRTKVEAEKCICDRGNSISFRLATVFGSSPCMRVDLLVNDFVLRALRDGVIVLFESHFKRNYIHVRDVCNAFVLGMSNFESMKDSVYNIGLSDANLSKAELCDKIKEYVDFSVIDYELRKDPDQRNYLVSNEKIESCGFVPKFSIDDGIKELIKSYQINDCSYKSW